MNGSVLNKIKKFGYLIPSTDPLRAFDLAGLPNKLPAKYNLIKAHKKTIQEHNIECNNYCVLRDHKDNIYNLMISFCDQFAVTTLYISKKYRTYFTIINDKGAHCTTTIYSNARNSYEQICDIIENNKTQNINSDKHCEILCNTIYSYVSKQRLNRDQRASIYLDLMNTIKSYCNEEFHSYMEQSSNKPSSSEDDDIEELLRDL